MTDFFDKQFWKNLIAGLVVLAIGGIVGYVLVVEKIKLKTEILCKEVAKLEEQMSSTNKDVTITKLIIGRVHPEINPSELWKVNALENFTSEETNEIMARMSTDRTMVNAAHWLAKEKGLSANEIAATLGIGLLKGEETSGERAATACVQCHNTNSLASPTGSKLEGSPPTGPNESLAE